MEDKNGLLTAEEIHTYEKLPVPFGVFHVQMGEYSILAASDGLCRMLHIQRQVIHTPLKEILSRYIHPSDFPKLHSDFESACLNPDNQYSAVYRVRTAEDSPYRWIAGKGTAVQQTDGSYLLYVYFSDVHDETELHREETAAKVQQDILFTDILSTTQTAIFWKDTDRRFLGANKAFLDYYGFADESEILGKNDEEMGWHIEPDPYKNDEIRVLSEGVSTYRVHGKCMAKGANRDIVASKSPLIIDGKIVGLVGSFEDVTKEVEQETQIGRLNTELKAQIANQNLLMSISEVCIVKIRLSDFTLLEYNDAMCQMIGCTKEEYENKYHGSMAAFFTNEYRGELEKLKKAAAETMAAGKNKFDLNLRIQSADGPIWIGGSASFTDFDPQTKQPKAMYAVYRDVTDLLKAQEIKTQFRRMRRLIDSVPSGLGALYIKYGKPQSQIQINHYFSERIDIAIDEDGEILLNDFPSCLHPDDRERFIRDFNKFLKAKTLTTGQYRFHTKDGQYIWTNVSGTIVKISSHTDIAYFVFINVNEQKIAEANLLESRRFYSQVIQAANLSTWDYDITNHTITMSEDNHTNGVCEILGIARVIPNVPASIIDSISEEDQPAFLRMYQEVEAGHNASCEAWYKPVNGREPRCERVTYISTEHPDGKPAKAIGFAQNITADRKVEERYQRELNILQQTDEYNLAAKGHYNLTKNIVLEYTTRNKKFFQVQPGISYDDAFHLFVNMSYQENEKQEIADKLDRLKLIDRYQHGQLQSSLIYHRARSGELPVWISMNIHTYMVPNTGDLECFTYAYDISEKMTIDEIMGLISNETFDYIGLIFTDIDKFNFIKKTPEIKFSDNHERTSYSACCEYVRSHFISPEEMSQFNDAVSIPNILSGLKESSHHTATYRRAENGHLLYKQMDYVWFDEQAKIVLVMRSDVTASFERSQKQLARIEAAKLEADRANEAKSTFLSSMSHDLRTPLNGVLGFTAFALKETDPQKKQDFLKKIDASGKLLLNLVNDTLELSRIESGKSVLEQEAVMPAELIPAVVTALRPSAELKNIRLSADFPDDLHNPIWCDRLKVQKIALNLISNSIKYTPEGGSVSVIWNFTQKDAPGSDMNLIIEDNGIGMSDEFMKRMYEPFSQEKRSEARQVTGTGLGLSIVKRYVDLMEGSIEVTSKLHQGTRWVVTLPVREIREGLAQKQKEAETVQSFTGRRILLCEDNRMNTEIAVMLLKEKGILVETAEDGKVGLEKFASAHAGYFDAILMDIRMPVMDGYETTRAIRKMERPDAATVPILAMTADAFEEDLQRAKDVGMNDYLTKPIEPAKLWTALAKAFRKA